MDKYIRKLIDDIHVRLNNLEEAWMWSVRADQRFRAGQRVKFSAIADRKNISRGRKNGVRAGTVVGTDGFSVKVRLDGYKTDRRFHHMFFEPAK